MRNMFYDDGEKRIPKSLKECCEIDATTYNLKKWCERLETLGIIFFWALLLIGFIDTIISGVDAKNLIAQIGKHNIDNLRKSGIEIPAVAEVIVGKIFSWVLYAFIEYCSYHALALLISSLASIVQHTKIAANVALFNSLNSKSSENNYEIKEEKPHENTKYETPKPNKSTKCVCGYRYYGDVCPNCNRKAR